MKIIIPDEARDDRLYSFTGKHPKTGEEELYFRSDEHLFEMIKYTQRFGSWFINDSVNEDGSLFILTKLDILFLALPHFVANPDKFRSLQDILEKDDNYATILEILSIREKDISHIADVKIADDESYFRYNIDKTLKWLECKVKAVVCVLKKKKINVSRSSAAVAGFCDALSATDPEEFKLYAFELVEQYLPDSLSLSLRAHLKIADEVKSPSKETKDASKATAKRPLEETKPSKDYYDPAAKAPDVKKIKLNRAQQQLAKGPKTTRSVTSFFSKAVKK